MGPFFRLIRAGNVAVSFAGTVVGGLAARGGGLPTGIWVWVALGLAGLSTGLVTAGGNVLNDIGDRDSDRVNHPDRPLVTGGVSLTAAKRLAGTLLVASGVAIVPIVWAAPLLGGIWVAAVAALLGYEFRFKAEGVAGNLLVAFLTGAVFLYGGAAVGNAGVVVPFALMAFGATLSREVIKDMEDAGGDVERRTLPRVHGFGMAAAVARLSVAAAIALSAVPVATFVRLPSAAGIMYAALVLVADALFVISVLWLPDRLHREQGLSKGAMAIALLAFLAVAFR
ncbi:MAG TPA: geranylgeranylglycerol-phosphate geranylgeranyltransferase [Thermoplasmata archaeon]|nr:geranylgeranylglycerol-phosphate geranylgeranyltransferase [Thermoplasmata archaeon]